MNKILLASVLLFTAAAQAAPTPASGELNATDSALTFSGGPFTVPNPTSDSFYLGGSEPEDTPVVCNAALMNCDVYALTVAIPDEVRSADASKDSVVRFVVLFQSEQPGSDTVGLTSFEAYLYDARDKKLARSEYNFTGADNSAGFELPLNALPNGPFELRVTANRGLGASYTAELALAQPAAKRTANGAAGGALAPMLLLALAFPGLASLIRR